jgi:hypothetical protein
MQQRENRRANEVVPAVTRRKKILLKNVTQMLSLAFTMSSPRTRQFIPALRP